MQACNNVKECQEQHFFGGTIARMGEESYFDYAGYLFLKRLKLTSKRTMRKTKALLQEQSSLFLNIIILEIIMTTGDDNCCTTTSQTVVGDTQSHLLTRKIARNYYCLRSQYIIQNHIWLTFIIKTQQYSHQQSDKNLKEKLDIWAFFPFWLLLHFCRQHLESKE